MTKNPKTFCEGWWKLFRKLNRGYNSTRWKLSGDIGGSFLRPRLGKFCASYLQKGVGDRGHFSYVSGKKYNSLFRSYKLKTLSYININFKNLQ